MKAKTISILFLITLSFSSLAQKQFGVIAGLGQSDIDNYRNYKIFLHHGLIDYSVVQNSFSKLLAWKMGAYYIQSLPVKRLNTEIELVLNGIGASYYFTPNEGSDYDSITYSGNHRVVYLAIPVNLQYYLQDYWYLKAGVVTSIRLINTDKDIEKPRLVDFGASIAFGLELFPKLDIVLEGYHGISRMNITAEHDGYDSRLFNSSITVSLKYELWKRE